MAVDALEELFDCAFLKDDVHAGRLDEDVGRLGCLLVVSLC